MTAPARDELHADALRIENVRKVFSRRRGLTREHFVALDDVSCHVAPGRTLGLVGESGSGKTTLLRTILGLHEPTSGTVHVNGNNVNSFFSDERARARSNAQVVFQDPYSSLDPRWSAAAIVAEPLRLNRRYTEARVRELFDWVGLPWAHAEHRAGQLSGGQRQRLGIARALALNPRLVLLDEPVSALDVSIQAQVINLLIDLQQEFGIAYLFVAHDLAVVRHVAHDVAVMHRGRIVEYGTSDEVFASPTSDYTKALLEAIPLPDPHHRRPWSPQVAETTKGAQ